MQESKSRDRSPRWCKLDNRRLHVWHNGCIFFQSIQTRYRQGSFSSAGCFNSVLGFLRHSAYFLLGISRHLSASFRSTTPISSAIRESAEHFPYNYLNVKDNRTQAARISKTKRGQGSMWHIVCAWNGNDSKRSISRKSQIKRRLEQLFPLWSPWTGTWMDRELWHAIFTMILWMTQPNKEKRTVRRAFNDRFDVSRARR